MLKKVFLVLILLALTACSGSSEEGDDQSPEDTPTAENQAPVAGNQTINITQGSTITIDTQGFDLDGDRLDLIIEQGPQNGNISTFGNQISYRPNNGFFGQDTIRIRFSDGSLLSNIAVITINVSEVFVNSPPLLISPSFNIQEDIQTLLQIQIIDVDGDDISVTILTPPANGQLIGTFPNLEYLSNLNFDGEDSFVVRISDGTEFIDATITIDVLSVNDEPFFTSQNFNVVEDVQTPINVLAEDVEGTQITYEVISNPTKGTLIGSIPNLEYLPNQNELGQDSFLVRISDGVNTVEDSIIINIQEENDPPQATAFNLTINEDEETVLPLSGTDEENDPLVFEISTLPNNAQIVFQENQWKLIPDLNFSGQIMFGYKANDGEFLSEEATVIVNIEALNDPPIAENIVANTQKNQSITFSLSFQDVDSSNLTVEVVDSPRGTVQLQNNEIIYTPDSDFIGYDGFTYQVKDDQNARSEVQYVDLTVVDSVLGRRWNQVSLPITIRIPQGLDSGLYVAIVRSVEKWNDALGSQILIINEEGDNVEYNGLFDSLSDFEYAITFQLNNWFPGEDTTLAVTTSQTVADEFIVNVDILFNFFGFPYTTVSPVPLNTIDFESVLVHEMGHLLGLPHIDPVDDPASVMNPTFSFGEEKRGLSIYDYQSIRAKYSLNPLEDLPEETTLNYMGMEVQTHSFKCTHKEHNLD